jgi:hypothetical protein
MSLYAFRGIYTTQEGDLAIGANGDLKLAKSDETISGIVNFIVRTDRGEYSPDKRVGADLGSFIGKMITNPVLLDMEKYIVQNLSKFVLDTRDLQCHAIPISNDTVGIIVAYGGEYIGQDGNVMDTTTTVLNYSFPYLEGGPVSLS